MHSSHTSPTIKYLQGKVGNDVGYVCFASKEPMSYNNHVDPFVKFVRGVFYCRIALKGAVCRYGYSSEQTDWINQTVPLSL